MRRGWFPLPPKQRLGFSAIEEFLNLLCSEVVKGISKERHASSFQENGRNQCPPAVLKVRRASSAIAWSDPTALIDGS